MELKATDFRIGNNVFYNGKHNEIGVISEIKKSFNPNIDYVGLNNRTDIYYQLKHLKQIPLTEEILLKCPKIKKVEDNNGDYFEYGLFLIKKVSDDFTLVFGKQIITPELKYLHDFQNKIFAITGEELEINL